MRGRWDEEFGGQQLVVNKWGYVHAGLSCPGGYMAVRLHYSLSLLLLFYCSIQLHNCTSAIVQGISGLRRSGLE
jgi:hypothetical protein